MIKVTKSREAAYKILYKVFSENAFVNLSQKNEISKLDKKEDRALCHEIVFGVLQNIFYLDFVISCFSKVKLKKLSLPVLTILRISLYQLYFLEKIPQSAAVNEGVLLSKKYAYKSSSFINAVLRASSEKEKVFSKIKNLNFKDKLSVKYSVPLWMIDIFINDYGKDNAEKICKSFSFRKRNTVRINSIKNSVEEFENAIPELPFSAFLDIDENTSDRVKDGDFYVQGLSSQICVDIFDPKESQTVLDACSAPGGKSFTSAQYMKNKGEIFSCDVFEHKIHLIENGASNLNIKIIKAVKKDMSVFYEDYINKFDKVLCDVPCSGFGIINKKPDIIFRKRESVDEIIKLSENILENCSYYVKQGGELIFSTCTLNKQENDNAVKRFIEKHNEFAVVPVKRYNYKNFIYGEWGLTILPSKRFDGFFISKMIKR